MNINVALAIASYVRKDGTAAIVIRVSKGKQTRDLPTRYTIPVNQWNDKKRQVKGTYTGVSSVTQLNNQLKVDLKVVNDNLLALEQAGMVEAIPFPELVKRLSSLEKEYCFFAFADAVIIALKEAKRIGTMNAYSDAVKAVENFHGSRYLPLQQLNFDFLQKMETAHLAKGNGLNGLAAYMRSIRAIYNLAIKSGKIEDKFYPFKKYTIRTERTQKRAISYELLQAIMSVKLEPGHICFDARNKFLISYMLYGMNFYDMALLERKNLIDGRVQYQRNKTSAPFNVKITPALQALLDLYIKPGQKSIFNVVKRSDPILQDKDIKNARRLFNDRLKDLAELCEIQTNLTSYVSRHSFATHAKLHKIPIEAISEMLGHTSIKTTQIYLDSLPSATLDGYNDLILNSGSDVAKASSAY
ncbi:MAG: site-specific integrase [Chitinophagales bacterium]|nr:site-specific integrase [Chitinophagales bacterium]